MNIIFTSNIFCLWLVIGTYILFPVICWSYLWMEISVTLSIGNKLYSSPFSFIFSFLWNHFVDCLYWESFLLMFNHIESTKFIQLSQYITIGSYDLDYFEEPNVGNKLPSQLKREIIHKMAQNYPTLNDIFKSYSETIRTLLLSRFPQEETEQFPNRRDNKYKNSY